MAYSNMTWYQLFSDTNARLVTMLPYMLERRTLTTAAAALGVRLIGGAPGAVR